MGYIPQVDADKCVGCGLCVELCPVLVFQLQDGKSVPVHSEKCIGCESCIAVCEENAITLSDDRMGFFGKAR